MSTCHWKTEAQPAWSLTWPNSPRTCRIKPGGTRDAAETVQSPLTITDAPLSKAANPQLAKREPVSGGQSRLFRPRAACGRERLRPCDRQKSVKGMTFTTLKRFPKNNPKSCWSNDQRVHRSATDRCLSAEIRIGDYMSTYYSSIQNAPNNSRSVGIYCFSIL